MRLRSIRLENIRRFIDPVEITGISDGLNVLAAPNERGKSTIFDALHVVFFKDRRSWDKEIRSLVPHAGGDPAVAVEIELADGTYRVEKRWNSKRNGEARILTGGRLVKQADDAEAWLAEALRSPNDGGPAGLLWVRQGLTSLEDGDTARLARRDLLTSVAGEVEAMTGGRQMDAALDACQQELERYLTKTGRAKSDGPLKRTEDEVAGLEVKRAELAAKSARLKNELDQRRDLRRELAELENPEEDTKRLARLSEAEASHVEASRHAEALEKATDAETAKHVELQRSEERLVDFDAALSEAQDADAAFDSAKADETKASELQQPAETKLRETEQAHAAAENHALTASNQLQQVLQAQAATSAIERRQDLTERLDQAEGLRTQIEQSKAAATSELSENVLKELETLSETARILKKSRDIEAAAITMRYVPDCSGGVLFDDKPLADGERTAIPGGAQVEIAGIGQLTIHPGHSAETGTLSAAKDALAVALATAGVINLDAARSSAQRRRDAESNARDAQAALLGVAPKGIDALRTQIAALPKAIENGSDLPTLSEVQQADKDVKDALVAVRERLEAARTAHGIAEKSLARASAAVEGATARSERASAAFAGFDDPKAERSVRSAAVERLKEELKAVRRVREVIANTSPNLDAAAAALDRARSIITRANEDRQRIRVELGKLDTSIDIQAGEAVDEELADVETRLRAAKRTLADLTFEVAVLRKLNTALEAARATARDRYVQPVLKELEPLLRLLWPEAELWFDAESVLPTALVRTGTEEDFDILSGGTQEQIALLVRLAFARMLARAGSPAPVILDDAIVFTDDDRIERMFDALTRQAQDLQIIVFSCRQKAFRDLGGHGLVIASANPTQAAAQ